ncbi:putative integral membrane protein [Acanthocheilonema viteae]
MYSHISKIENTEQLNASNVSHPCYNNRKMIYLNGGGEKRKTTNITMPTGIEETLTLHTPEEPPPPRLVVGEYDMEFQNLSNFKLESNKRYIADGNGQSSEPFRKRGTRNSIAISLVIFFHQMVNKRQLMIAVISCICGMYAIYIALSRDSPAYGYESRHQNAYAIKNVLLLYGLVQLFLSIIFFCIYATTKANKNRWCYQIIRFIGCIIYLLVALFVLFIGFVGFYWVIKLYGHVEYEDRQSIDYIDMMLYNSSLFTFSFHICFVLLKCCWWN